MKLLEFALKYVGCSLRTPPGSFTPPSLPSRPTHLTQLYPPFPPDTTQSGLKSEEVIKSDKHRREPSHSIPQSETDLISALRGSEALTSAAPLSTRKSPSDPVLPPGWSVCFSFPFLRVPSAPGHPGRPRVRTSARGPPPCDAEVITQHLPHWSRVRIN